MTKHPSLSAITKVCYPRGLGRLAQLVERYIDVVNVRGSTPLPPTGKNHIFWYTNPQMEEMSLFFAEYKQVSIGVHVLAAVVGMGSALFSDALFNRFISDFKIDRLEHRIFSVLSKIIWISLFIMLVSGVAIFMSDIVGYSRSDKFLAKMTVVLFIILNGFFFKICIDPSLRKINFYDTNNQHKYVKLRKLSFAFGAVSVISWLFVCGLALYKGSYLSYSTILSVYAGTVTVGVLCSQILEKMIVKRANQ